MATIIQSPIDALLDGQISWNEVQDKPSTFTPSTHTHSEYASLTANNTFAGDQTISELADSSRFAWLRLISGGVANSRAIQLIVSLTGGFFVQEINDDGTSSKTVLSTGRNGGVFLFFNGSLQLETTDKGVKIYNLPTSATGLPSGHLYKDSNNFIKVVP